MPRLAAAGALALLLGWAAAHGLSLQWWTLVPWGLAAVALGYRANRATAVVAGALYGFVLCFVFTLATYGGAAPAITRVPFFTVLGLAVQVTPLDSLAEVVLRLAAQRRASHLGGAATQLAAILADDFIDIGANGVHRTKQQNVEDTRARVIQWTTLVVSNEQVQVFDSTAAVVTGEQQGAGTYGGRPFARRTRYIRVYLKRNGRWQNVAAQSALITP